MKKLEELKNAKEIVTTPRLTNELKEASLVQEVLLRHDAPPCQFLECHGQSLPCHYLGGDYYDFVYEEEKHKYWVFAGDVMGKGIPAFTKMAMLRTAVRTLITHSNTPADLLENVNATLYEDLKMLRSFATLFCGMYDLKEHTFTYSSAGHPPAILKRNHQDGEFLNGKGVAVGFLPKRIYQEYQLALEPDDYIFVFTDGVAEAMNENKEQFGREKVMEAINQKLDYHTIIPAISESVLDHSNNYQRDDITMVTLKRKS